MSGANNMVCSCGAKYAEHRTGLTFATVRGMMRTFSHDPSDWRHKRRRSVLGFWHELKLNSWFYEHGNCARADSWNGLFQ